MIEDLEPDFTVDDLPELCSEAQQSKLEELSRYGWQCSHLWERSPGEIVMWCIVRTKETEVKAGLWAHCFIIPDGTMIRYDIKKRFSGV